jgi:hypothetical protein
VVRSSRLPTVGFVHRRRHVVSQPQSIPATRYGRTTHPDAYLSCRRIQTEIEIPVEPPDYERIDAAEALALLRELYLALLNVKNSVPSFSL